MRLKKLKTFLRLKRQDSRKRSSDLEQLNGSTINPVNVFATLNRFGKDWENVGNQLRESFPHSEGQRTLKWFLIHVILAMRGDSGKYARSCRPSCNSAFKNVLVSISMFYYPKVEHICQENCEIITFARDRSVPYRWGSAAILCYRWDYVIYRLRFVYNL
jgi:hypothetical protein